MISKSNLVVWAVIPVLCALPVQATEKTAPEAKPVALPPAFTAEPSPPANIAYQALRGIVITRPGAKVARISLGENSTLRVGARVEYLRNGLQIATGRVVELNRGDALVSIEPEAADHYVNVNTEVRIIENPAKNLGSTEAEKANREYSKFEKEFAISAAIAGAVYYVWIKE